MITSPVDGHLDYFQFCVIIYKAAMIILIHISGAHVKEFLLNVHQGVQLPPRPSLPVRRKVIGEDPAPTLSVSFGITETNLWH